MGGYIRNTVLRGPKGISVFFPRAFLWAVKGTERIYSWGDTLSFA